MPTRSPDARIASAHDQAAAEPRALLHEYLRDKELLLVADNCEHLIDAVGVLVDGLLKAAPGVRVIATSREPLSVAGKQVIPVPPLELPAPGTAEPSRSSARTRRSCSLPSGPPPRARSS